MNLLPYHAFEIRTSLSPEDAHAAFSPHVEDYKYIRWRFPSSKNDTRFEGELGQRDFRVCRILGYRNSFAPWTQGEIQNDGRGARILVRMSMHIFAIVFSILWCAMLAVFLLAAPSQWYFLLGMFAFAYGLVMIGFWTEANKQEQTLRQIFKAI